MKHNIPIYGTPVAGPCPSEMVEMASFFNRLRKEYPEYARIALHIRNEGLRSAMQVRKIKSDGGFVKGASDVIIPGSPTFVMEMKSTSKNAKISLEQVEYLEAAEAMGAFVCVAIGAVGAWKAFNTWINSSKKGM